MSRKTAPIAKMLKSANFQLARTDEMATTDFKRAICSMIEDVLMSSGNYRGFGFIDNDNSDLGTYGYYSRFYYYSSILRKD